VKQINLDEMGKSQRLGAQIQKLHPRVQNIKPKAWYGNWLVHHSLTMSALVVPSSPSPAPLNRSPSHHHHHQLSSLSVAPSSLASPAPRSSCPASSASLTSCTHQLTCCAALHWRSAAFPSVHVGLCVSLLWPCSGGCVSLGEVSE
jgi:hypothetical protein